MTEQSAAVRLNELLTSVALDPVSDRMAAHFELYLQILMRWNQRLNLTAIRDQEGILRRHFVESIACARLLPEQIATLLDFGSGAGFPGVPIALSRPEVAVTLAESQAKKAAFLQEVLRTLGLPGRVFAGRAEDIGQTFDCAAMRAVDRMGEAVRSASGLVSPGGWLALMTTGRELRGLREIAPAFDWQEPVKLPMGEDRLLALGRRGQ